MTKGLTKAEKDIVVTIFVRRRGHAFPGGKPSDSSFDTAFELAEADISRLERPNGWALFCEFYDAILEHRKWVNGE